MEHQPVANSFPQLQAQVHKWQVHNFEDHPSWHPHLGMIEEIGELSHAYLKMLQHIRGTVEEHHAAMIDAIADWFIFFADYCNLENMNMEQEINIALSNPTGVNAGQTPADYIKQAAAFTATGSWRRAIYYLVLFARYREIDWKAAIFSTWEQVKLRDWKAEREKVNASSESQG